MVLAQNQKIYMDTLSLTKEAKIYNGEKTASSVSGKTEQLHVKERDEKIL